MMMIIAADDLHSWPIDEQLNAKLIVLVYIRVTYNLA